MLVYFSGRSDLIDPAVIQDGDAVGHAHCLFLIVRDVQHGHAEPLLDFLDLDLHLEAQILVEGAERLVHQHDRRVKDDRAGQCDTLLLPAGQLMRVAIGEAAEPHQVERPIHPLGDVVFGPAPSAQRESHILEDVQVGKDRIILKHHAETALLRRHRGDILAVEEDGALIWPHKPGDHHQSGGLARARRPEQRKEFARRDRDGDGIDHGFLAVAFAQPAQLDRAPAADCLFNGARRRGVPVRPLPPSFRAALGYDRIHLDHMALIFARFWSHHTTSCTKLRFSCSGLPGSLATSSAGSMSNDLRLTPP